MDEFRRRTTGFGNDGGDGTLVVSIPRTADSHQHCPLRNSTTSTTIRSYGTMNDDLLLHQHQHQHQHGDDDHDHDGRGGGGGVVVDLLLRRGPKDDDRVVGPSSSSSSSSSRDDDDGGGECPEVSRLFLDYDGTANNNNGNTRTAATKTSRKTTSRRINNGGGQEQPSPDGSPTSAVPPMTTTGNTTSTRTTIPIGAVANLCNATLGAGVLAIPYALYQAGLYGGIVLLLTAGIATYASVLLLSQCIGYYHYDTYEALAAHVLHQHPYYRQIVELSLLVFCGGCAVAYVIAVGDILEQAGLLLYQSRAFSMVLVWTIAMMPLSMLRRMNSIAGISAVGVSAIGTLVFATAVHALTTPHVHHHHDHDDESTTKHFLADFAWPAHGSWLSVLTACPVVLFAFSCQANVCAIYAELVVPTATTTTAAAAASSSHGHHHHHHVHHHHDQQQEQQRQELQQQKQAMMSGVAAASVGLCAALYTSVSVFVLADFGSSVLPNMLLNYRVHDTAPQGIMQVATAAMAIAVILAYPLNIFPARVALIGLLDQRQPQPPPQETGRPVVVRRATTTSSTNSGFLPNDNLTQALLEDLVEEQRTTSSAAADDDGAAAVGTNGDSTALLVPPSVPAVTSSTTTTITTAPPPIPFNRQQHVVVTLFLTGTSLALALIIPDIKVMFGLLGGTASSLIGFCVPGRLGLQLAHDIQQETGETPWTTLIISWCLFVGGAIVGVVTTVATIYELVVVHQQ
jgi:amino acid permease